MPRLRNDRCYTVHEIDQLTKVVSNIVKFDRSIFPGGYQVSELEQVVGERVRTYMLAGVTADEVQAEVSRARQEAWELGARYRIHRQYSMLRLGRILLGVPPSKHQAEWDHFMSWKK